MPRLPLALLLALLLLLSPMVAAQNTNDTSENDTATNQTTGNQTDGMASNATGNMSQDANTSNGQMPERPDHVPWTALVLGVVLFFGAIIIARET